MDVIGLKHALNGLKIAVKSEKNLRIHLLISILVTIAAILFPTSPTENIILIVTICIVIFAELINTTIEKIVDLVCIDIIRDSLGKSENNDRAMFIKDVSAGAVLATTLMAVLVGALIFIPKIQSLFVQR